MNNIETVNNLKTFEKAFLIRYFEELLLKLFNQGLLNGTVHTCVGQEIIPVVISELLLSNDRIFSNHRGHGHYIAANGDYLKLLAELMGKKEGISGGIGGSQHLFNENFISNGIQGGLTAPAVGYAFVNKMRNNGGISVCYIGDGSLGQGIVYESLNLSSILNSPTLFVLENNQYAQSTSINETFAGSIPDRVQGFGIEYFYADIWDLENLKLTVEKAIKYVRNGKPAFLEVKCYRLNSHSKGDDNRSSDEIKIHFEKDLLNNFKILYPNQFKDIDEKINQKLNQALEQCLNMPELDSMEEFQYLLNRKTNFIQIKYRQEGERNNKRIYNGLKNILENKETIFLGEDIKNKTAYTEKSYGGAFKVSQDLSDLFPNQVFNSPISEQAIIGFGIGAALNGYRAIIEIMFGDFMTLGVDQIVQQASKIPTMFAQNICLPLIIRTPMGARRGYGPTHSQNIEKLFFFLPNINVVALNSLIDAEYIYNKITKVQHTTIVIEDKIGYTKFFPSINEIIGYNILQTDEEFPTIILKPTFVKHNCIIFLYGGMLDEIIKAVPQLIENDFFPLIICPTSLIPLNIYPIIDALRDSKKIIFIEEGSRHGGLSSEIISYLSENQFDFQVLLRISNESIIPCAKSAELKVVPNTQLIIEKFKKINL